MSVRSDGIDMIDMKAFVQERDLALVDLVMHGQRKKFERYAWKYGVPLPKDEIVLMAGACKALLESTSPHIEQIHREKAEQWLLENGMKPGIGV